MIRLRAAIPVTAHPSAGKLGLVAIRPRPSSVINPKSAAWTGNPEGDGRARSAYASHELCRARSAARAVTGRGRSRLYHAHADPGAGNSRRPRRTRRHGRSADRHRQDRRLRAADPAEAGAAGEHQPVPGAAPGARADPHPDPRARGPGRGIVPHLLQVHEAALDRRLRRRRHQGAARNRPRRRRNPGRHAGPAARPHRAQERLSGPGRDLRPRRSRPHARHGLHSRHQADHGAAAGDGEAAEPAVLGHVQQRDQEARRPAAERTAIDRSRAAQHRCRNRDARACTRCRRTASARCWSISSARAR